MKTPDHGAEIGILHNVKRSPKWNRVMKDFLKKNPGCAVCGKTDAVNVHHVINFEIVINMGRPDLELDERNLITLCETEKGKPEENHHIEVGHGGNFFNFNPDVREDALKYHGETLAQLKANHDFLTEIGNKTLPSISKMTDEQRALVKGLIDSWYPLEAQK